jgi:hypothetical protein
MGVDPFVSRTSAGPLISEPRIEHDGHIQAGAVTMFADALVVASHRFGWPSLREVLVSFTHGLL